MGHYSQRPPVKSKFARQSMLDTQVFSGSCWSFVGPVGPISWTQKTSANAKTQQTPTSWLFQPIWKISVKLDHFPKQGYKYKYLKPPPTNTKVHWPSFRTQNFGANRILTTWAELSWSAGFDTPGNPPATPIMKGIPTYSLLVKVARGVFQRCVETTLDIFNRKIIFK